MNPYTKEEIQAANGLIKLNNISYLEDNLYHPNIEIRNYNRTTIAINISNYLKLNNEKYNYYFFEKIINCFKYYQKNNKEKQPRIPPDFLNILWKILRKQKESHNLVLSKNVENVMEYDLKTINKTNEEIEIEDKILNLYN
jgi:hypothetical protein